MTGLAGTRKLTDTTRRLLGVPVWGHQGTSRIRQAPVADPALIRSLDVGQVAYIYRGGVTFVQVKRLIGGPAGLPAAAGQAAAAPPGMAPSRTVAAPQDKAKAHYGPAGHSAAEHGLAEHGPAGRMPPEPAPAPLRPGRDGPSQPPASGPAPPPVPPTAAARQRLPDVSELLDEAFGPEASP